LYGYVLASSTCAASLVAVDWLSVAYFFYREWQVQKAHQMCTRSLQFHQLNQQLQGLSVPSEDETEANPRQNGSTEEGNET